MRVREGWSQQPSTSESTKTNHSNKSLLPVRGNPVRWETTRERRTWILLVCSSFPPGKTTRTRSKDSPDSADIHDCEKTGSLEYFLSVLFRLIQYPPAPCKGRIAVTKEDLACLDGGEFLNDVIIDFYLKWVCQTRNKRGKSLVGKDKCLTLCRWHVFIFIRLLNHFTENKKSFRDVL